MLLVRQIALSSNKELFQAAEAKNAECRQLKQELEMKDAQIASYEEARKKDEGDKFYFAFKFFFAFFYSCRQLALVGLSFLYNFL